MILYCPISFKNFSSNIITIIFESFRKPWMTLLQNCHFLREQEDIKIIILSEFFTIEEEIAPIISSAVIILSYLKIFHCDEWFSFSERMTSTDNTTNKGICKYIGLCNIRINHVDLRNILLRGWVSIGWAAIGMLPQEQGADRRTVRRFQVNLSNYSSR